VPAGIQEGKVIESHVAAYIAGFLDGEGYVTIRRSNRTKYETPS
jgi:hypothetical protein